MLKNLFWGAVGVAVGLIIITAAIRISRATPLAPAGNVVENITGLAA